MEAMAAAQPPQKRPSVAEIRAFADAVQQGMGQARLARFGVTVRDGEIAGVPVRIFETPASLLPGAGGKVLLNFHGGGFMVDSGSLTENIHLAAALRLPIVSALYRMAPEHPFPAAVDDALAVYRALTETRSASNIAVFGTSAGAILGAQLLMRLKAEGLAQPAALGFFSGIADFARDGDCESYLQRLPGGSVAGSLSPYAGATPRRAPALSPIFGDLAGLPPTLVLSSTRDQLLSASVLFHRALLAAGAQADLIVFEALPHAFWAHMECPETDEAFDHMAAFFRRRLGAG